MSSVGLPVKVSRSVERFLMAVDEVAPGLGTGFYLVGSVALGDFRSSGAGRGRLSTASDIDFVAITDRRVKPESREMAALAEAHARTVARFPRPYFDGAVLTWADLADIRSPVTTYALTGGHGGSRNDSQAPCPLPSGSPRGFRCGQFLV